MQSRVYVVAQHRLVLCGVLVVLSEYFQFELVCQDKQAASGTASSLTNAAAASAPTTTVASSVTNSDSTTTTRASRRSARGGERESTTEAAEVSASDGVQPISSQIFEHISNGYR